MSTFAIAGRGKSEEPEWTVWLTVLICLLIGWVIMTTVTGRTDAVTDGAGNTVRVPATWVKTSEDGALLGAADLTAGAYGSRVSVRQAARADLLPERSGDQLEAAASNWTLIRSQELEGYRVLEIQTTTLQGRPAVTVEYAYLTDPPEGLAAGAMPALMHAVDTIMASGEGFAILTVATDQTSDESLTALVSTMQSGWQVP
jgi:hypothetical protein